MQIPFLDGGGVLSVLDLNFVANRYNAGQSHFGTPDALSGWSFTRASAKTALDSRGNIVSFASGVPAITDLGLLVEEARTNLALWSQDFSNVAWGKVGGGVGLAPTVTANAGAAPDGTNTAARIQLSLGGGTTTADQALVVQSLTTSGGSRGSFWAKTNDGTSKTIYVRGASATSFTVTGSWQRYDFDAQTLTATQFGIGLRGGQTPTNNNTADILVWGAQLEVGSFPTSYIPTTSAAVTRAADVASIGGLSLTNATLAVMATPQATDSTFRRAVSLNDGTTSNEAYIGIASSNAKGFVFAGGVQQAAFNGSAWTGSQKVGLSFAAGAQAASFFGGAATTAAGASAPTATTLNIGHIASSAQFDGYVQSVRVYTPPLSNAQLPGL